MRKRGIAVLMAIALATSPVVGTTTSNLTVKAAEQTKKNLISKTDWNYFTTEGGKGTVQKNGSTNIMTVQNCGTENYSMQLYHEGFQMYKNGVYELSFEISSTIPKRVN